MPGIDALTQQQRAVLIREGVMARGTALRQRYPILQHQDAIGVAILSFALLGMGTCAWLYVQGFIAWWVCLLLNGFFAALTHELEHDLIHSMYFRKQRLPHNLMLALVWLARPSTINPWIRRYLHINHHKVSGSQEDTEERGITNGQPWGFARLLMVGDNILAGVLHALEERGWKRRAIRLLRTMAAYAPLGLLNWGCWYVFLLFHAADLLGQLFGQAPAWSAGTLQWMHWLDIGVVVLVGPNVLRTFSLHFISSNMHYYGDIETGNVIQQTQVLNPWRLWPLQVFCCNFGSTHGIHHFVVKEPFYIRQLTASVAHPLMREMGVRFNDFGTFTRANRWQKPANSAISQTAEA